MSLEFTQWQSLVSRRPRCLQSQNSSAYLDPDWHIARMALLLVGTIDSLQTVAMNERSSLVSWSFSCLTLRTKSPSPVSSVMKVSMNLEAQGLNNANLFGVGWVGDETTACKMTKEDN